MLGPYSRAGLSKVKAGSLRRAEACRVQQRRSVMSGGQMAYLVLVIAAFSTFAVVLFGTYVWVNWK
jgi:hypothetical protein